MQKTIPQAARLHPRDVLSQKRQGGSWPHKGVNRRPLSMPLQFGEMLTKSTNIFTAGAGGPIFAWAAPGDIVICGEVPEDFHGRVCSVKFPDEESELFCCLYRDGENVRVGYMDDYDIWKSYPADAVTIRYEVLAVVHQYGPMEPPKAETAWEKRVTKAAEEAFQKFSLKDYDQLIKHHRSGRTVETLATAFALGYQAGKKEARSK